MKQFNHVQLPNKIYNPVRKTIDGKRWYVIEGTEYKFPSITTVLSATSDNSWIHEWHARVGKEEANRVSRKATTIGTQFHKACENYLNNLPPFTPDDEVKLFYPETIAKFKKFIPILNRIDNIYCQEHMMASIKLGVAGTVDLIAEFDGVLSIIDFKTSKRHKEITDIQGYFVQESAYSVMFYDMYKIPVSNLVTLMSVDSGDDLVYNQNIRQYYGKLTEHVNAFNEGKILYG